jgi:hypothetical protein
VLAAKFCLAASTLFIALVCATRCQLIFDGLATRCAFPFRKWQLVAFCAKLPLLLPFIPRSTDAPMLRDYTGVLNDILDRPPERFAEQES